jgi:hypothetical protein
MQKRQWGLALQYQRTQRSLGMLMVIPAIALVVAGCGDAKRKASAYQRGLDRLIHAHSDIYSHYYNFFKLNGDPYSGEVGCVRLVDIASGYSGDERLVALHGCLDAASGNASLAPLTDAQRAYQHHLSGLTRRYPDVYASYEEDFADLDNSDEALCIDQAIVDEPATTGESPLVSQDKTLVAIHACQDAANAAGTLASG